MSWLVTGGAGYIGGHTVRRLRERGHPVVVLDDLSTGLMERIPPDVPFVAGCVTDRTLLGEVLRRYRVEGVVHLAARKSVGESLERPEYYHQQNVGGVEVLLDAMRAAGVRRLVFASSAAVYGEPRAASIGEDAPTVPVSPYGAGKLLGEQLIRAAAATGGLSWMALRYFNVLGAADQLLAERCGTNLLPLAFDAVERDLPLTVFGADHPTPDGTAVRDYVHVGDVAEAHVAAVERLSRAVGTGAVYNVGSGRGHSVRDVLDMVAAMAGGSVPHAVCRRRAGDPSAVVSDSSRIRADLGWSATLGLAEMVGSAWCARVQGRVQSGNSA